jgi:hypothetical protein
MESLLDWNGDHRSLISSIGINHKRLAFTRFPLSPFQFSDWTLIYLSFYHQSYCCVPTHGVRFCVCFHYPILMPMHRDGVTFGSVIYFGCVFKSYLP